GQAAERVYAADVSGNFFETLAVDSAIGRTFAPADEQVAASVAVLSHGFWQRRFGADPQIVGRVVDIDGHPRTVVGVMREGFEVPVPADLWLPLTLTPAERARRDTLTLRVIGRLAPTATLDAARAELATIGQQLERAYPITNANRRPHVMVLTEFVQGTITRAAIFMLIGLVAVVLLIACANIAGLQLARAAARERDAALRTALGANRWRLAQFVVVENVILGLAGGA